MAASCFKRSRLAGALTPNFGQQCHVQHVHMHSCEWLACIHAPCPAVLLATGPGRLLTQLHMQFTGQDWQEPYPAGPHRWAELRQPVRGNTRRPRPGQGQEVLSSHENAVTCSTARPLGQAPHAVAAPMLRSHRDVAGHTRCGQPSSPGAVAQTPHLRPLTRRAHTMLTRRLAGWSSRICWSGCPPRTRPTRTTSS